MLTLYTGQLSFVIYISALKKEGLQTTKIFASVCKHAKFDLRIIASKIGNFAKASRKGKMERMLN